MPEGALYAANGPRRQSDRDEAIVMDILREFGQLSMWRNTFASQWEEAAELILPTSRNTFMQGNFNWPGQKKTERQIDATGMMALAKFAAICDSLLTPRNMTWHSLTGANEDLKKDRDSRLWYEAATKALFKARYSELSNFCSQNENSFIQLGAFGNQAMFVDELDTHDHPGKRGLRYKSIPVGELFIGENHQGLVNVVIRYWRMTAAQAWEKWGPMGTFPEILRPALEQRSPMMYQFLHRVAPNREWEPGRLDMKGKPWSSQYISMEGKVLLQEGGYRKMPYAVSRYQQTPGEIYGRGPAQMVLPALKTLNAEKATFLKAGHRASDPVLLTTDDGIADMSMRPGALNKGGVTADGRELIKTIPIGNIQITKEMMAEEKGLIQEAFLVSLFQILTETPQMTATEVIERTNEKGILLAPTVGRQQSEYLGPMIERELDVLMWLGMLPPMPPKLAEARGEYEVSYDSPLSRAMRAQEASGFIRTIETVKELVAVTQDQSLLDAFDFDTAIPAIAEIQGSPESWMATPEAIQKKRKARAQSIAQQQSIQAMPAKAAMMKAQAQAAKAGQGAPQAGPPQGQLPAQGGPPLAEQLGG
jgi:hypothetical protein